MGPALTLNLLLGEIEGAHSERWGLRLAVEAWEEPHRGHTALGRFLPPADRQLYVRGEPYVLLPQVTMSVVLPGGTEQDGSIGRLAGPPLLEGLLHHRVGSCQAWVIPSFRVALIWEAYLYGPWRRSPDPQEDRGPSSSGGGGRRPSVACSPGPVSCALSRGSPCTGTMPTGSSSQGWATGRREMPPTGTRRWDLWTRA